MAWGTAAADRRSDFLISTGQELTGSSRAAGHFFSARAARWYCVEMSKSSGLRADRATGEAERDEGPSVLGRSGGVGVAVAG